uniref:Ig-like domain-containing protein n=1 Tax=Lactiplantibacillus herbarum TaxID=1670446 RepID=UPI000B1D2E29
MFGPPLVSQAREVIEASGVDANSAVIKDDSGNVISHSALLPEDQHYVLDYKWSIPNGVDVTAGDTMSVQIPANVQTTRDSTFPMVGAVGGTTIGSFAITKGSHTGTVTFNQVYQFAPLGRTGYIHLNVYGTEPNQPLAPILMDKSAAWVDENDPTHINWTVNVISNSNELVDPTFNDTLSPNQTYVPGSVALSDQKGNAIPVSATVNGNKLTFNATGSFVTNLKLTYQTATNNPSGAETFNNDITYTDQKGNTGSASASIDRPATEPEKPGVTDPENPGTTDPENPG